MSTSATSAPAASRLALATLCVAGFLAAMNFFATSPFYADMADDLDTSVPLLGQLVTLMLVISAVLGLFVGPLADRYGIRELLALGMGAIALNLLGTAAAPSYLALVPLAIVGALGDALVFGLAFALASSLFEGDSRRRAIGWTMAAVSVAPIVGVPVLTTIGGTGGWRVAVATAGILAVVATWMTLASLPVERRRPDGPLRLRELVAAYAPIRSHTPTRRLLAVTALRAIWMLGLVTYLGAYLRDELGLSTERVGLYYMVAGAGTMAGSFLAGSRLTGRSPLRVIAAANILGGLLGASVLVSPAGWVMVLLPLAAVAGIVASVTVTAQVAVESPAPPGTTMVLNSSLLNAGAAGGALVFGVLLALGGYQAIAIGLPVVGVAAAALAIRAASPPAGVAI
jgi:predicted MFS family arabinose efflux permease